MKVASGLLVCCLAFNNYLNAQFLYPDLLYPFIYGISGGVNTIEISSDAIYLGGSFSEYNSTTVYNFVKINTNGEIDDNLTLPVFNDVIYDIEELSSQQLLVAGKFKIVDGVINKRIVKLNADGSQDTSFHTGFGFDNFITNLEVQDDNKIIAAGDFTSYNYTGRRRILRLEANGEIDLSFHPQGGFDDYVNDMILSGDKIYCVGNFTNYNSNSRKGIVRILNDGSIDSTFNPGQGFNNSVSCIRQQADGKLIVSGAFTTYNGYPTKRLVRILEDGNIDFSFNTNDGFNASVTSVAIQPDNKIIVAGPFYFYNDELHQYLLRLNIDGSVDETFDIGSGFNGSVLKIALEQTGDLLVLGDFSMYNQYPFNNISRLLNLIETDVKDEYIDASDYSVHYSQEHITVRYKSNSKFDEVVLFDAQGKKVNLTPDLSIGEKNNEIVIDRNHLIPGIYLLQLNSKSSYAAIKVISF